MPKRIWQLNYKRISKESCVSILREVRGELPEPGGQHFWDFLQPRNVTSVAAAKKSTVSSGVGPGKRKRKPVGTRPAEVLEARRR